MSKTHGTRAKACAATPLRSIGDQRATPGGRAIGPARSLPQRPAHAPGDQMRRHSSNTSGLLTLCALETYFATLTATTITREAPGAHAWER